MKILLFLGASGSGKTTYIEQNILKDKPKDDFIEGKLKFCKARNTLLFGHYISEIRCKGCDTLSMTAIEDIKNSLQEIINTNIYEEIVLDGDRINNANFFDFILNYKSLVTIYWFNITLDTIFKRLPEGNKTFIKTTMTKTNNMIQKYKYAGFKIIKIEEQNRWF